MKRLGWALGCGSILALSALACVDLFHSTSTPNLCDLDASAPGCTDAIVPPTLCAPDAGVAQASALRACAWLSACSHPVGQNQTGECMVDAILAFDCAANPNRALVPGSKPFTFWQCMQSVMTCKDVAACVMPDGIAACASGGYIGCTQSAQNPDTRFDCVAPTITEAGTQPAPGEDCAMHGQTCDSLDRDASNHAAICVGPLGRSCAGTVGCVGTKLSLCDEAGVDEGYDCAGIGLGSCNIGGASPSCMPSATMACSGTNDVTCTSGNVEAVGCVTNTKETLDCTALSGAGTCNPIEGGAPGTIPSDACYVDGGCTSDTCNGALMAACVRGRSVSFDCTTLGLEACNPIATEEGTVASCNPPPL